MKKDLPNPPALAARFFAWFCHMRHLEGLEGDLYELFDRRVETMGVRRAKWYYILDMVTLLRSSVARPIVNNSKSNFMGMLNNYVKTTFRMGWKRKGFSFINLFGLTLGLTSVLFIGLYVQDEVSYDQHISGTESKFRLYNIRQGGDGEVNHLPIVPPVFATSLREEFPQVKQTGRLLFDYGGTIFNVGDKVFSETNGVFAEPEALDILDFELVKGSFDSTTAEHSILLSESLYAKFFGDEPYSQQQIKLTRTTLQVAGVFKDLPERSHLDLEYIFPFSWTENNTSKERMQSWVWQQFYTYVELEPNVDHSQFELLFRDYVNEQARPYTEKYSFSYTTFLQPMRDIHLHSVSFEWDIAQTNSYQSILFLSIAAGIILLIACLNFINLTTAQALKRAKEVSVRKFIGAKRSQLLLQYGLESTIYTFVAGIISLILFVLLMPTFNDFADKNFVLLEVITPISLLLFAGGLVLLGMLAGWYPALVLTRFDPLAVIHGVGTKRMSGRINFDPRQLMVGAQYVLSISLILISLIMQNQYQFLRTTDMGFNKENLLVIPLTRSMFSDLDATRNAFLGHSRIENVSFSFGIPGGIVAGDGVFIPSKQENEFSANMILVDEHYLQTLKIDVLAGRGFSTEFATDADKAFVINETAVRNFGFTSPEDALGAEVKWNTWGGPDSLKIGRVIGVVADFNFKSLHNQVSSVVLHMWQPQLQNMIVRTGEGNLQEAMTFLEAQYRTFEPTRPFEPVFVDRTFEEFYDSELRLSQLFSVFTGLAILTATIGLFGLVTFSVVSRAKEISIRKVLGAGSSTIFKMLISRYFWLVLGCMILAFPLSYTLADKWLNNFAYRIEVGPELFLLVGSAVLALTILTVGFQAIKGASANPSERLRSE